MRPTTGYTTPAALAMQERTLRGMAAAKPDHPAPPIPHAHCAGPDLARRLLLRGK